MRFTVIGSTGRTGRHVLAAAQRRGHELTAFTRRPDTLDETDLTVVHGDGRDPAAVAEAVDGAEAVIAIVAATSRRGPHEAAAVAECLVTAMTMAGVKRLVTTSAYPIVGERPRLAIAVLRRLLADSYADARRMEHVVSTSTLDWTIVRLNRLIDKPPRGNLEIAPGQLRRPRSLTRADAGATLVDVAEADTFMRSAINVGGAS